MKRIALSVAAVFAVVSAYAQGTVNFSTFIPPAINAPVTYQGDGSLANDTFWGQLIAGPAGGALAAVGSPVQFRSDAGRGYITAGGSIAIPGVAGGSNADIQVVAWSSAVGSTWAEAQAANLGGMGNSPTITIALGGAGTPPGPPVNLTGLAGFQVSTVVPEPSIAALGLLGAGLLMIRRKK